VGRDTDSSAIGVRKRNLFLAGCEQKSHAEHTESQARKEWET